MEQCLRSYAASPAAGRMLCPRMKPQEELSVTDHLREQPELSLLPSARLSSSRQHLHPEEGAQSAAGLSCSRAELCPGRPGPRGIVDAAETGPGHGSRVRAAWKCFVPAAKQRALRRTTAGDAQASVQQGTPFVSGSLAIASLAASTLGCFLRPFLQQE